MIPNFSFFFFFLFSGTRSAISSPRDRTVLSQGERRFGPSENEMLEDKTFFPPAGETRHGPFFDRHPRCLPCSEMIVFLKAFPSSVWRRVFFRMVGGGNWFLCRMRALFFPLSSFAYSGESFPLCPPAGWKTCFPPFSPS